MHHFGHFDATALAAHPLYEPHAEGYRQTPLVDHAVGSVHTGLAIAELAAGGTLAPHVHSYEESFYVLSGEAVIRVNEQGYRIGPGDLGVFKVGTVHAWRAAGSGPVRWLQMAAPQPKPQGHERDTFFLKNAAAPMDAPRLDLTRLDGSLLGHFGRRADSSRR
jgi:quercetin dioxygenase-like cupin family protein